ncbi:spore coat protein [Thermaerobacter sp. PB12/4term]|uniref:spore coat protein n=1 Tax=Thermaerobacter sp. PB12/4term TaxID=2293838 RepID=UPI000E329206|nr:spore coat protein [Thermaerobacter sp. PB12/4term]QIA26901.1 spore coat protein [Thermaerobacter sp. PB12/4term]
MLSQKELLNLPELLNAHAAMIEKAEAEQAMCQDEPLRQILQRHSQVYRRHYGQLQWMLDRARGQGAARPPAGHYHGDARWVHGNGQATQGFQSFEPYRPPAPQGHRVSDRTLAVGCLEMNKHACLAATWTALEAAHPEVRRALLDIARDHAEMAFELFQYLQQRNWYAVPQAPVDMARQVAQGFPGGYAGAAAPGAPRPAGAWAR